MNQIVSDGIHVVRVTGQKMRSGVEHVEHAVGHAVEHAADGVKHEVHEVRGRFKKGGLRGGRGKQASRWQQVRGHSLDMAASTVGAVAAFFVSVLIRGRNHKRK